MLVIDMDEIHDAFKIALIQSPLVGRVGSYESSTLTFCTGARCVFCYYPPHQLRTASMSSTSTFIEFVVLPFDANVTEYQTSEVDSAKKHVAFNLLPPLLACIFQKTWSAIRSQNFVRRWQHDPTEYNGRRRYYHTCV